ncbi:MAG: hypothetical protein II858_02750 [Bacteroidales bacterium]|nr:hypothetical protein [Bacteroidales bacterium]
MKRIVILIVLAAVSTTAFAQRAPQSTSYKDLKNYYSARDYVKSDTDPYSVFWIGLESLAAPGLGQLIMKETGRGWAFLGTSVVLGTAGGILAQNVASFAVQNVDGTYSISEADRNKASGYLIALGGVALAQLAVDIWSCVDAVKIAKVKNQYYQDGRRRHANASLYPSVNLAQTATGVAPAPGMTFALTF